MNSLKSLCIPSIINIFEEDIHTLKIVPLNHSHSELKAQKEKITSGSPKLKIIAPCKIDMGILRLTGSLEKHYEHQFDKIQSGICFFVPASGSGSRMFDFLQTELNEPVIERRLKTQDFLERIRDFAFYLNLQDAQKEKLNRLTDSEHLIDFLLKAKNDGVGLQSMPKALVPFHSYAQGIRSAFIEHLSQGFLLHKNGVNFHFTIQQMHQDAFKRALLDYKIKNKQLKDVVFSFQDPDTDAFVFDKDLEPLSVNDSFLRRPSGHGALLENLNSIKDQYILIKNIDNVQHNDKAASGLKVWKILCGILHSAKQELVKIWDSSDYNSLLNFNEQYGLFSQGQMEKAQDENELQKLINRPLRICGMVLNEGKAGGGPFFVEHEGSTTKQIVEGVQVTGEEQSKVFESSSHFNPVMMAIDTFDMNGDKFDLKDFSNEEQYFVVDKNYNGQKITFVERPGLWNGSMFHWNTLFIEIPSSSFTPVKTVLDLLKDPHLSS